MIYRCPANVSLMSEMDRRGRRGWPIMDECGGGAFVGDRHAPAVAEGFSAFALDADWPESLQVMAYGPYRVARGRVGTIELYGAWAVS